MTTTQQWHLLIEIFGFFFGLLAVLLYKIQSEQSNPYMDEIFHIPQTQDYCNGNFHQWNPKITTFPGLYFIALGFLKFYSKVLNVPLTSVCDPFHLRFVNCILAVVNLITFLLLIKQLDYKFKHIKSSQLKQYLFALNLSFMPLLFFYAFLFYTEQASTLFVLLTLYNYLKKNQLWYTLFGAMAVFTRQTNIIWLLFICALVLIDELDKYREKIFPKISTSSAMSQSETPKTTNVDFKILYYSLSQDPLLFIQILAQSIFQCSGLILVGLVFLYFVIYNNGIVLGDRSAHYAVCNIPQFFYFSIFSCALTPSRSLSGLYHLICQTFTSVQWKSRLLIYFLIWIFCLISVHFFTVVHPYTLADNRHFVFYIWSKGFRFYSNQCYLYTPLYAVALCILWHNLHDKLTILWRISFFTCVFLSLVSSPLLELRYFVIPFFIYRLFQREEEKQLFHCVVELILYTCINFFVFYLFLYKTFEWPQEPGVKQRFM